MQDRRTGRAGLEAGPACGDKPVSIVAESEAGGLEEAPREMGLV